MIPIYVDTSVLVSVLFNERGASFFWGTLDENKILSSFLTEAELYSAAKRVGVFPERVDAMLGHIEFFSPSYSLQKEYRKIYKAGYCKGADTYHLACALDLSEKIPGLQFLSADRKQTDLAKKMGLKLVDHQFLVSDS